MASLVAERLVLVQLGPPWSAAAWRRFGHARSALSLRKSGARPPHSKETLTLRFHTTCASSS